ncbi:condensation domain-containing protein [Bacillus sonorensis]|nr:condensation domain-containing protein [Bacillus sonorensis]
MNRGTDIPDDELYALELFDLRDSTAQARREIEDAADRMQQQIRLETDPMLHAGLFRAQDGDHLFLTIHHLVIDAVSWRILFEDFSIAYEQAVSGEPIVLPQKQIHI